MRTLDALILRLEQRGTGVAGVDIFAGTDVNLPDQGSPAFLTLVESAGNPPIGTHNAGSLRRPGIQVTARGDLYPEVAALAERAFEDLGGKDGLTNILLGDVFFLWIRPSSDLFSLPVDAKERVRVSFNLGMTRR